MTDNDAIETQTTSSLEGSPPQARQIRKRALVAGVIGAVVLCGAGALAFGRSETSLITPIGPTPIASLQTSGAIAAKGDVADIYGNKFILQDATGRALIDTGREGEGGMLVKKGETVQVQGRFAEGSMHATLLTHADGRRVALGPVGGPPHRLARIEDRLGLGPKSDVAALTALVQSAGYTDVRVAGRGPRHLDMVGRGADGKDKDLHVDFDGRIRSAETF